MNVLIKGPGVQNKKMLNATSIVVEIDEEKFVICPSNTAGRLLVRSVRVGGIVVHPINLYTVTVEGTLNGKILGGKAGA